ncbi:MAG: hypothetical protein NZ889_02070 [Candidatus Pacearchaeota archaeon]|nr:hypothetical protein [Candidatus Pacearchaeota archaeon]
MPRKNCPNKKENENKCPCIFLDCPRHGICCECLQYHKTIGNPTACVVGFRKGFSEEELEE